jgi:cation transport regulator
MAPYECNEDLPAKVIGVLPPAAQTLYRNAYNSMWARHVMPLRRALAVSHAQAADRAGWAAVRRLYVHNGDAWTRRPPAAGIARAAENAAKARRA